MPRVGSRGHLDAQHEREKERETRTLVVKNVNRAVDDADFKQLFEVCWHPRSHMHFEAMLSQAKIQRVSCKR